MNLDRISDASTREHIAENVALIRKIAVKRGISADEVCEMIAERINEKPASKEARS